MHGTFSHFGGLRPNQNVLTEDAMFHALQEVYAGQPVIYGGKPTFVQFVARGLVWLAGFAEPVPLRAVESC
jgi:hypothetical protein